MNLRPVWPLALVLSAAMLGQMTSAEALDWPVGAKKGAWSASATEKISGASDSATRTAQ